MASLGFTNGLATAGSFSFLIPQILAGMHNRNGRTAQLAEQFAARNVKPIGLSTDSVKDHNSWISDVNDTQNTSLNFPIIGDKDMMISDLYEMIHSGENARQAVRSVFIIDPNKKIRLTMTYPMNVGRNFNEILRVIDALQLADEHTIATPADWMPGMTLLFLQQSAMKTPGKTTPTGLKQFDPIYV